MKDSDKLAADQIRRACQTSAICCLIGEALSTEAGALHFRDVTQGVWSEKPGSIDPFNSAEQEATVRRWFAWRTQLLARVETASSYQTLAWLKNHLQMPVATECVDNLAHAHGMPDALELYGNVMRRRCHDCGQVWGARTSIALSEPCPLCVGTVWPDLRMFGWNTHEAVQTAWALLLRDAQLLIRIGAPSSPTPESTTLSVLDIDEDGLRLRTPKAYTSLRTSDLHQLVEDLGAAHPEPNAWPAGLPRTNPVGGFHRSLTALCRLISLTRI